jgi:putative transposase
MTDRNRRLGEELAQEVLLDDPNFLREIVERVLKELLEAQMTEHIGATPYKRTQKRTGHRNGHKLRTLRTRVGTLNLPVPQNREGTFSTRLFAHYQRNEKALVLALMEMYVKGVSTRKVKEVTEELCGVSFSKSLVSRGCYERARKRLTNAENGGPARNRAERVIRILMRFFDPVHSTL